MEIFSGNCTVDLCGQSTDGATGVGGGDGTDNRNGDDAGMNKRNALYLT